MSNEEEIARKHNHYFKDVEHLTEIDVYRVCGIFEVSDNCGAVQHAIKKLLLPGRRGGGKSYKKDIEEAVSALQRKLEIMKEDGELDTNIGILGKAVLEEVEKGLIYGTGYDLSKIL